MRFLDGVLEQYMNRPNDADGQHEYWESMLYLEFHRKYRLMRGKKIGKTDIKLKRYHACTDRVTALVTEDDGIISTAMYCVPWKARSDATRPVVADWFCQTSMGKSTFNSESKSREVCIIQTSWSGRAKGGAS